jgi:hypothetical protein
VSDHVSLLTEEKLSDVTGPAGESELHYLIATAMRAPSGDNTQPWRFVIDTPNCAVDIIHDPIRDKSPMNAGGRMSRIACGTVLENLLTLAAARGWRTHVELFDTGAKPGRIARVVLAERLHVGDSSHAEVVIAERVSNRRLYDAREISPLVLSDLNRSTSTTPDMNVHWITDRVHLNRLADIIACGDTILFNDPTMRSAFLKNVRFDLPDQATASEGMPLASLQLSAMDRVALRCMPRVPQVLFALSGAARVLGSHARKLARSASGFCVITPRGFPQQRELGTGQAAQRAWLALTDLGLAAQPMMSLMVVSNALQHGSAELVASLKRRNAVQVINAFNSVLKLAGIDNEPSFLLRFGYAPPPGGRTGRREFNDCVSAGDF